MTPRTLICSAALIAVTSAALAGAPLKGIDVKLGKNPGGYVSARTSDNGNFTFAVLPQGEYTLLLVVDQAATLPTPAGLLTISNGLRTAQEPIVAGRKSGSVIMQDIVMSDGKDPIHGSLLAK
jgi:hypothetical protein